MHVKVDTEVVWEGERLGVGSVIEVPAEVFEKNQSFMKATDEPLNKVKPAKDSPKSVAADAAATDAPAGEQVTRDR